MLLFPQKHEKTTAVENIFYVISLREEVQARLSQLLCQAGINEVRRVQRTAGQIGDIILAPQTRGVIIDIGALQQTDEVVLAVQALVPRGVWCCVVGDSDSISLAQDYARFGIFYFYLPAQDEELAQAATAGIPAKVRRLSVNIGILGCKGGIGNTTIAHQLVNLIVQQRQKPTLFIQGKAGSHDLDLLFDKKFTQDLIPISKHLDAMKWKESGFPEVGNESFDQYNFIVFEETVNSADKEQLRQIVEKSSCLIVTLDRSVSAVRMARQIIEIYEQVCRAQPNPKRLLLCLSDSRPVSADMANIEDLQLLLGRKIDIAFPWRSGRANASRPAFSLRSKTDAAGQLLRQVLGELPKQKNILVRGWSWMTRSR